MSKVARILAIALLAVRARRHPCGGHRLRGLGRQDPAKPQWEKVVSAEVSGAKPVKLLLGTYLSQRPRAHRLGPDRRREAARDAHPSGGGRRERHRLRGVSVAGRSSP